MKQNLTFGKRALAGCSLLMFLLLLELPAHAQESEQQQSPDSSVVSSENGQPSQMKARAKEALKARYEQASPEKKARIDERLNRIKARRSQFQQNRAQ